MLEEKCKNEIQDGSASCENESVQAEQVVAPTAAKFFSGKKKIAIIAVLVAVVLIAAAALTTVVVQEANKISMKEYVKVTMEGYEGHGRMTFEFADVTFGMRAAGDEDAQKFGDREDADYFVNYRAEDVPEALREKLPKAKRLLDSIEIDYTLPEGKDSNSLENGDVITFTVTYNEILAQDMGLTFKNTTFEYVVEGLKSIQQIDLLSYCELQVGGWEGYGRVELVCKETATIQVGDMTFYMEEGVKRIRYTSPDGNNGAILLNIIGDTYNKSNGDVIKPNLNLHSRGFEAHGVEVIGLDKEYTVSGLPANPQ